MPLLHRPNLLFVLFDSLSASDCNFPHGEQRLPTLSKLCESSTLFTRAYTPCPESSPARASLFTGLDPCVHGLWTNGVALPSDEITFPQRLADAGYNNALVGRWQLAGASQWTTEGNRPCGFAHTDWAHGPLHRSRQNTYLTWLQGVAANEHASLFATPADPDHTTMNDEQVHALLSLPENLSFNHWVGEQLCGWIKQQSTQDPFLAIASFCVGDLFGTEPNEFNDGEALHAQSLQQADAALGRLLDHLRASDLLDDTVVIVTAARGNTPERTDSTTKAKSDAANAMSERALKVPLLISTSAQQRRVVSTPVSTMDISPTVLDFAAVPCGPRTQGQTLRHAFSNPQALRGWSMSRRRGVSIGTTRHWYSALCTQNRKLVMHHTGDTDNTASTFNLFDLETDPLEVHDLAALENSHTNDDANHDLSDKIINEQELEAMIDTMIDARCALEDRTEPRIASF